MTPYKTGTFCDQDVESTLFSNDSLKDLEQAYKEWLSLMEEGEPPFTWTRDSKRLFDVFSTGYMRGRTDQLAESLKPLLADLDVIQQHSQ